jgi:hypothetical protein
MEGDRFDSRVYSRKRYATKFHYENIEIKKGVRIVIPNFRFVCLSVICSFFCNSHSLMLFSYVFWFLVNALLWRNPPMKNVSFSVSLTVLRDLNNLVKRRAYLELLFFGQFFILLKDWHSSLTLLTLLTYSYYTQHIIFLLYSSLTSLMSIYLGTLLNREKTTKISKKNMKLFDNFIPNIANWLRI